MLKYLSDVIQNSLSISLSLPLSPTPYSNKFRFSHTQLGRINDGAPQTTFLYFEEILLIKKTFYQYELLVICPLNLLSTYYVPDNAKNWGLIEI